MTNPLRSLYDWTLAQAAKPYALWVLAAIAFAEASFFPIPQDVLFIPLILAARQQWRRVALIALVFSVLGGLFGYAIGYFLYDGVGAKLLSFYGKEEAYAAFQAQYEAYGWQIVFAGAFTPIPYKVITIASGVVQMNIWVFLVASLIGRGIRFFLLAYLLYRFGPWIRSFVERWFGPLSLLFLALLLGGFFALKYL